MFKFDDKQSEVLGLDPRVHARILGAPGSGKTTLLVEVVRRLIEQQRISFDEFVIFSNSRLTARTLRDRFDAAMPGVVPGGLVRTPESFAFQILGVRQGLMGLDSPRLLTGAQHDEILREVIEQNLGKLIADTALSEQVLMSRVLRDEIRDFERIANEYALVSTQPLIENEPLWASFLWLLNEAFEMQKQRHLGEFSSNQMVREAAEILKGMRADDAQFSSLPKLVLIDDAGETTRGSINLLRPLAALGTAVWAFGDPDIATGAFQGQSVKLMGGVSQALGTGSEQLIILDRVYRHGSKIRQLISETTSRIGSAGAGTQRKAVSAKTEPGDTKPGDSVQFYRTQSIAQQVGVIAHRLRSCYFGAGAGIHENSIDWSDMLVVCRSQLEAKRVREMLDYFEIPTRSSSGGIILREHEIVNHLVKILLFCIGEYSLEARELRDFMMGPLGSFDVISMRRINEELHKYEEKLAATEERDTRKVHEYLLEFLLDEAFPVKTSDSRKFVAFGKILRLGMAVAAKNGSVREILWQIWAAVGLATQLQETALTGDATEASKAHEKLDAAVSLFYVLQRHEEQSSTVPIAQLLFDVLTSDVAQDTLATQAERDAVLVTTVQGTVGQEFELVCVVGPQEGIWPNLRLRGSILNLTALENSLNGQEVNADNRKATLHDELRLFATAISRSKNDLLVVAIDSETEFPSVFYELGRKEEVTELPDTRFSLRGFTAVLRKRLELDPADESAASSLALLARKGVPGADPDSWYGYRSRSTDDPLVDLGEGSDETVSVSPSKIETAEECPLNWAIDYLGGGAAEVAARLGTILHKAFENVAGPDFNAMSKIVEDSWPELDFEAAWQSDREHENSQKMLSGLVAYLEDSERERSLFATETNFELQIDRAILRGVADRIELAKSADGQEVPVIVDLKTIAGKPTSAQAEEHIQMQAYQAGLLLGTFFVVGANDEIVKHSFGNSGGAKLLYVHPKAQNVGARYRTYEQAPMTNEQLMAFKERVSEVAEIMAGSEFRANVSSHCNSSMFKVSCTLHTIPAVSFS